MVCDAADTASLATWILFGKLIGVATHASFGEKRCRKNLPLGDLSQMSGKDIPYHRTYSRILVGLSLFSIPLFLLLPNNAIGIVNSIRLLAATFGISIASLWCPVLVYAGVRTRNTVDIVAGGLGAATLLFWVPLFLSA